MTTNRPGGAGGPTDLAGSWVGDELQRAIARGDALERELEQVRTTLRVQQEEIARLHDTFGMLDGRTLRHEAGQDLVQALSQQVATLREQVDAEADGRRELRAQLERAAEWDHQSGAAASLAIETLARRTDAFTARQAAEEERQRHLAADLSERGQEGESLDGRLVALERHAAADREVARNAAAELARLSGLAPDLVAAIDELRARLQAVQSDQRRLDNEIAAQRAIRDREADLLEALEQQRASRARTEERLNEADEEMEALRRSVGAAADERAVLARAQSGIAERMRVLGEELEQQRLLFVAHLRRQLQADELAGRRQTEEIERAARAARDLLVRLSEEGDDLRGGKPL